MIANLAIPHALPARLQQRLALPARNHLIFRSITIPGFVSAREICFGVIPI